MKISLNSLRGINQRYGCMGELAPNGVDELLQKIGAQLGGIEEVIHIGKKYEGVLIVKVVSCEQHPNADRLHVCRIDDGGKAQNVPRDENGLVQVVCGAPNVTAGVTVAWLPPGATVPSTFDTDPFVLEARELRGVVSNGMLASPRELGIGDSHEGLLLIEEDVEAGTLFGEKYGLQDDVVIDIENKMFTHRPDCFGWLGVGREIAGIQQLQYKSPDWYQTDVRIPDIESTELKLEIRNEIPELVPRFTAVTMSNVSVGPSPVWLQVELSRVGLRPINNIVDFTNFFMLETGQPLHAYDYDKVVAQDAGANHATIVVRKPNEDEKLTLLNGKEIQPRKEAILIASNTKAIGLGGVMGGADTEVDENTTNIILECANFDMYSIRKTAMAHGIFSDAVTRFNKGQSPLQTMAVLAKIVDDVRRNCGGKIAGRVMDDNHLPEDVSLRESLHPDIKVGAPFINDRLGLHLSPNDMAQLLVNVEFKVDVDNEVLLVRAPFWRTDIEIPEDIVEEVGRLYGYDHLPLELPKRPLIPAHKDRSLETKSAVRAALAKAGANEVLTYSFVHVNVLDKAGQDKTLAYKLSNALSPDLQYYRLSLMPSLLAAVHANIKAGFDQFALFEIGKAHSKSEVDENGLPKEFGRIGLVYAATAGKNKEIAGTPYYEARKYLEVLIPAQKSLRYVPLTDAGFTDHQMFQQLVAPFEPGRSAVVFDGGRPLGVVGEYKPAVARAFKLPAAAAGFEVFTSFFEHNNVDGADYVPLPRFPKVTQDITLRVKSEVPYQTLHDFLWQALEPQRSDRMAVDLRPLDIYQRAESQTADASVEPKQITFRLSIASYERTLTDTEVSTILESIAAQAHEQLGAEVV